LHVVGTVKILGTRNTSSYSSGTTYQASTDGFLTVQKNGGVMAYTITIVSDSSSTPTTTVGSASSGSATGQSGSVTVPIRKGDYFTATTTGSGTGFIHWVPLGN
jgi:hypothetical protein